MRSVASRVLLLPRENGDLPSRNPAALPNQMQSCGPEPIRARLDSEPGGDLADRLIAATSSALGAPVVTGDDRLLRASALPDGSTLLMLGGSGDAQAAQLPEGRLARA